MAIDFKYGRVVTEYGEIGEDEPVVVFRARDKLLVHILDYYAEACADIGSPQHHIDLINRSMNRVEEWQHENMDLVRVPNSDAYAERLKNEN